jgi:uncharacterized protein (TIGR00297 family)
MILQLLLGFSAAILISYGAYRARSLSKSGAWGALIEGTIIFGLGGLRWAVVLMAFFISSSLLTRLFRKQKTSLDEKFDKGGRRDIGQVLANGGVAAAIAGLQFFLPDAGWTWVAFAASLAAVNADTWATELGVLNPRPPLLITTGKQVERGTSGGISPYGVLASLGGAGFIAVFATLIRPAGVTWSLFPILLLAGIGGALFDSLMGATVQGIYTCPRCAKETEKHPRHGCGEITTLVRGWKWLNNDMVNLGCSMMGTAIGVLVILF